METSLKNKWSIYLTIKVIKLGNARSLSVDSHSQIHNFNYFKNNGEI